MKKRFVLLSVSLMFALPPLANAESEEKEVLLKGEGAQSGYSDMSVKHTVFDAHSANPLKFYCAWLMNDKFNFEV